MEKVEIDEAVVGELLEITGVKTQQDVVDKASREMPDRRRVQRKMLELEGKIERDGNLDAMRRNR